MAGNSLKSVKVPIKRAKIVGLAGFHALKIAQNNLFLQTLISGLGGSSFGEEKKKEFCLLQ